MTESRKRPRLDIKLLLADYVEQLFEIHLLHLKSHIIPRKDKNAE